MLVSFIKMHQVLKRIWVVYRYETVPFRSSGVGARARGSGLDGCAGGARRRRGARGRSRPQAHAAPASESRAPAPSARREWVSECACSEDAGAGGRRPSAEHERSPAPAVAAQHESDCPHLWWASVFNPRRLNTKHLVILTTATESYFTSLFYILGKLN